MLLLGLAVVKLNSQTAKGKTSSRVTITHQTDRNLSINRDFKKAIHTGGFIRRTLKVCIVFRVASAFG